jgi:uncharacterized membrane protein
MNRAIASLMIVGALAAAALFAGAMGEMGHVDHPYQTAVVFVVLGGLATAIQFGYAAWKRRRA